MTKEPTLLRLIASQILCLFMLIVPNFGYGQNAPVVVELFSSQGCSSCPPADEYLVELAQQRDIIALGWHVDYWDYIGWADGFAHPSFTERQKAYARALDERMIYTPQFIINGVESSFGGQRTEVASVIQKYAQLPPGAELSIRRMGSSYEITLQNAYYAGPYDVHLVGVSPLQTVDIHSGENAGRQVDYANIVTEWHNLGLWDGLWPTTFETGVLGPGRYVVLVQYQDNGEIVVADWVN